MLSAMCLHCEHTYVYMYRISAKAPIHCSHRQSWWLSVYEHCGLRRVTPVCCLEVRDNCQTIKTCILVHTYMQETYCLTFSNSKTPVLQFQQVKHRGTVLFQVPPVQPSICTLDLRTYIYTAYTVRRTAAKWLKSWVLWFQQDHTQSQFPSDYCWT